MTLDEALHTLGLELPHDPAAARRAYLRLIKTHSPERDPGGFQRVRAAYELLSGSPNMRVATIASGGERVVVQPTVIASASLPLVQSELADDGDDQLDDSEPEHVGHDDGDWAWRAHLLSEQGDAAGAVDAALAGLAQVPADGSASYFHAALTNLGLKLFAQGELEQARRLMATYGTTETLGSPGDPVRFELLRDLTVISAQIPLHITRALAAALYDSEPERLDPVFKSLARRHPLRVYFLRTRLAKDAPTLYGLYAGSLRGWQFPKLRARGWQAFILLQLVLGGFRYCRTTQHYPVDSTPTYQMVHIDSYQRNRQVVIQSCTPSSDPICAIISDLGYAGDCASKISLVDDLRKHSEAAKRAGRVTRLETDAIDRLRVQTFMGCGGGASAP